LRAENIFVGFVVPENKIFYAALFETKDAGFETKDAGFATKCENLFTCIHYFSMCLAAAEKSLMADYLPIIRQ
jgi:hypothetical protein